MALDKSSNWNNKYDTHKNGALQMRHTLRKNSQSWPYLPKIELSDFWKEILKYDVWFGLKIMRSQSRVFPLRNDIPGTILSLIVVGLGSISRVLVVLQKTKNVGFRCHLCWVPFLEGCMFDKRSALYVRLC